MRGNEGKAIDEAASSSPPDAQRCFSYLLCLFVIGRGGDDLAKDADGTMELSQSRRPYFCHALKGQAYLSAKGERCHTKIRDACSSSFQPVDDLPAKDPPFLCSSRMVAEVAASRVSRVRSAENCGMDVRKERLV